jgi:aminoglycoside phosphotransferase (APT) family kinase protein
MNGRLVPASVRAFAAGRGLTRLRHAGGGVEFEVFAAAAPDGSDVVLRTPAGGRFQFNANDGPVDTRSLLRWEHTVTRHLAGFGFPVARPRELVLGDPDVLVSEFIPDDGDGTDQVELGGLLKRLHQLPVPPAARPPAAHGLPTAELLPRRITDRFAELSALVTGLAAPPPAAQLAAVLRTTGQPGRSLLHLDVRGPNLRCAGGVIRALIDWSNALIGDPALELARLAEYARLPDNGLDYEAILSGYHQHHIDVMPVNSAAFWIYRLDTAVMLALLFSSEIPYPDLGPRAVDRLRDVHQQLTRKLTGWPGSEPPGR